MTKNKNKWTTLDQFLAYLVFRGIKDASIFLYRSSWSDKAGSLRSKMKNFEYLDSGGCHGLGHVSAEDRKVFDDYRSLTDEQLLLIYDYFSDYLNN